MKEKLLLIILILCFSLLGQAQVLKTVDIGAGGLSAALTAAEKTTVTNLTITGTIDARDFKTMRDDIPLLAKLDISGATIVAYSGTDGPAGSTITTYLANAIPAYAFFNTSGVGKTSLTSIILPASLIEIMPQALRLTGLTSVTIPEGVTKVGQASFAYCSNLAAVSLPSTLTTIEAAGFFLCTKLTSVVLPSSLTTIAADGFNGCTGLSSIIIPNSMTTMGTGVFTGCTNLATVSSPKMFTSTTFPANVVNVTLTGTIDARDFKILRDNITSLATLNLSGATITAYSGADGPAASSITTYQANAIPAYAFYASPGKTSLTTVILPSSLTEIMDHAFRLSGLTSVTIPEGVTKLGISIFYGCSNLASVSLPSALTAIGHANFYGCTKLTSVSLPSSLITIDSYGFFGCSGLTSMTIPASVTSIGGVAFSGCTGLTSIYAQKTTPVDLSASTDVFASVNKTTCKLYVPSGSVSLYKEANQWKDFYTVTANEATWTGTGSWDTAANWSTGSVPIAGSSIIVGSGELTVGQNVTVVNLIVNAGAALTVGSGQTLTVTGNLTIKSGASASATLVNNGTLAVSGTSSVEQYLTGDKWHIVTPTAAGGSISSFIQTTANGIPNDGSSGTDYYGMMDYNEGTNTWNNYFTASVSGNFEAGKGYMLRRNADGLVTYTGSLASGNQSVSLSKSGSGWNCIGNPYPSAININNESGSSFLTANASSLDASYGAIYVWDESAGYDGTTSQYKVISNAAFSFGAGRTLSENYIAPGQAFLVKAAGSSPASFTAAMQSHQNVTLKSGQLSWPAIRLSIASGDNKASTVVAFNSSMTKGLDPTYDAGLLRNSAALGLYSKLVADNGTDFAIQCLPETYESLVIPLGIDSKNGGKISFSAETAELPSSCSVILEDKTTGTFTLLTNGAIYETSVTANTSGTGRFYIHTSALTTGSSDLSLSGAFSLKAYPAEGAIIITGEVGRLAKASLFSINGKKIGIYNLQEGNRNSIPAEGLTPGVYLLNVTEGNNRYSTKIVML